MLNNFTVVLPGGCNAKCSFCPDSMEGTPPVDWLLKLSDAIKRKPFGWTDVSITGGEPTISPYLESTLSVVSKHFRKTVLTTNGVKLVDKIHTIGQHVDFLNVSRHGIGADNNMSIFKTKRVISDNDLSDCIYIHRILYGGAVNLNHVYLKSDGHIGREYLLEYVEYAKRLGANSVSFRYDQTENCLGVTELEKCFLNYPIINSSSCPVCRSHTVLIHNMPVTFKALIS